MRAFPAKMRYARSADRRAGLSEPVALPNDRAGPGVRLRQTMPPIRYITRPRALELGDDWYETTRSSLDVIVETTEPINTGLLDADGNRLFRMPQTAPMGFCR